MSEYSGALVWVLLNTIFGVTFLVTALSVNGHHVVFLAVRNVSATHMEYSNKDRAMEGGRTIENRGRMREDRSLIQERRDGENKREEGETTDATSAKAIENNWLTKKENILSQTREARERERTRERERKERERNERERERRENTNLRKPGSSYQEKGQGTFFCCKKHFLTHC